MDRTQKRCLVASVALHAGLLGVIVLAAAFSQPPPALPDVPVLEMIPTDLKLTDGNHIGGGSPTAKPPAPQRQPEPARPVDPQPEPPKKAESKPKPTKVEPKPEPKAEPKSQKPPAAKEPESTKADPKVQAQDVDPNRKAAKPAVQVSSNRVKRTNTDAAAAEARAQAAREKAEAEAAEARAREIEAANSARQQLASRLRNSASSIAEGTGTSTKIEMPGPGGEAYAPYISYLGRFYKERWRSPRASTRKSAYVGASVTIARDGSVVSWDVIEPSGLREVDDSVRDVLKRYAKLRPLPEGSKDSQRRFTIQFRLDADTAL